MHKIISSKIVALIFGVLVICFALAFYVVAWQEPSQSPPGGNVSVPINVSATAQTKEGDLTINGVLKTLQDTIVNLVTIKGDGSISPNLNSDKLDDYNAADLMAAGGVEGCVGGLCSELPVGYAIDYDWDKDGKSAKTGDCDETCKTCYSGSTSQTATPDGKDQDCDGTVDETIPGPTKTCNITVYEKRALEEGCSSWCSSRGAAYVSVTTVKTCWSNAYTNDWCTFDWNACSGQIIAFKNTTVCSYLSPGAICTCAAGYQ